MIWTGSMGEHLDANKVLSSVIYAMLDEEGCLSFIDERFERKWQQWLDYFSAVQTSVKTIAPFPI
jgi:hypothetical protein